MPSNVLEVLNRIEEIDPSLKAAGESLREEWFPNEVPLTILAGYLADAVVVNITTIPALNIESLFRTVEEVFARNDEMAKDVIATGFLEALLAAASAGRFDIRRIVDFLGPHSLSYCRAWDDFTGVRTQGI